MSSFKAPLLVSALDSNGLFGRVWQQFWRLIEDILSYLGKEEIYQLENNQSVAVPLVGLKLDKAYVTSVTIEAVVQRVTSAANDLDNFLFTFTYDFKNDTWVRHRIYYFAGNTMLDIDSTGQVTYTTSNLAGTQQISRIILRKRELAGKNSLYSKMG